MIIRRVLRSFLCAALAAILAIFLSALAYSSEVPMGFPEGVAGKTLVGVQTADLDSSTLSYTVPLYVTLAVTNQNGSPAVLAPDNYCLRNTTTASDGKPRDIAVVGMSVRGVANRTWNLKSKLPDAKPNPESKDIKLSIGNVILPELLTGDTSDQLITLNAPNAGEVPNAFYNGTTFVPIKGGTNPALSIPIVGTLAPGTTVTKDVSTTAQFRISYTVSLLDQGGKPIGAFVSYPKAAPKASDVAK